MFPTCPKRCLLKSPSKPATRMCLWSMSAPCAQNWSKSGRNWASSIAMTVKLLYSPPKDSRSSAKLAVA